MTFSLPHPSSAPSTADIALHPFQLPSRAQALWFAVRATGLRLQRSVRNLVYPVHRWPAAQTLVDAPVLTEWRTPLWSDGRSEEEFALVAGKVHNLRLAVQAFHGIEVPAGEIVSFWRQLGRVTAGRGFVCGREVREGCVIPTLGGGLCQLSNALATCVVRAGGVLVERHGHTRRVEQGGGEAVSTSAPVDATVFWNYVDLRVQLDQPWRLEVELTRHALVMRIRARRHPPVAPRREGATMPIAFQRTPMAEKPPMPAARGCLTCAQTACFRHREHSALAHQTARTAWLLDTWTPEFERHLRGQSRDRCDVMLPRAAQWRGWTVPGRSAWRSLLPQHVAWGAWGRQALRTRWTRLSGRARQATLWRWHATLAADYARQLTPQHTHLVIDQALLPWLWRAGVLGGRHFEVLMHSLPLGDVQQRLDAASQRWPTDLSLKDFRVDSDWASVEAQALRHADRLVTPHREVARVLRSAGLATVLTLDWALPDAPTVGALMAPIAEMAAPCIVLGASALGRKGVHELAHALQGQACEVWVLGSPASAAQTWGDLTVRHATYGGDWPRHALALVLPAHIEHAPRAALRALAQGVPVIATPACGLEGLPGVVSVPAGDVSALWSALQPLLATHTRASRR